MRAGAGGTVKHVTGDAQAMPAGQPAIRTIAMPADTNPSGDIFGGWLMSQMDLAAGNLAALVARGRAATIAVDGMRFHLPVKVGDEVSLFADLTGRGRSSMHIHVTAWRRRRHEAASEKVTCATFVFVAIDTAGRPRALPAPDDGGGGLAPGAPTLPGERDI